MVWYILGAVSPAFMCWALDIFVNVATDISSALLLRAVSE